jgi:hypothetical protein
MLQLRLGMAGYEKSAKSMNGMTQFPSGSVSVKDSYVKKNILEVLFAVTFSYCFQLAVFLNKIFFPAIQNAMPSFYCDQFHIVDSMSLDWNVK